MNKRIGVRCLLATLLLSAVPAFAKNGGEGRGSDIRQEARERGRGGEAREEWRDRRDMDGGRGREFEQRRQGRQLTPEERRQLRRDVMEANRDFGGGRR